jgi:murein endopeptidase
VLLPAEGPDHTTWDAIDQVHPNRDWRRVGTDRLVRTILTVAAKYRRENPGAPRVVVSDLSLPQGARFGPEYGGLGHASHQNGLDVDVAYPRKDRQEIGVERVQQVDRKLAQALVTAFVEAGAQYVFVGPRTGLKGPRAIVQPLGNHDDHLHFRLRTR